jgi:cytochrome c553
MKILVAALITALFVFILATGWMEIVQPRLGLMSMASSKSKENSTGSKSTHIVKATDDESDEEGLGDESIHKVTVKTSRTARQRRDEALLAEKNKAEIALQLEEVKKQESKLVAREQNLRMLYDDIRTELAAIEEIRRRSATELAIAEQKVQSAAKSSTNVASADSDGVQRNTVAAKSDKAPQTYIAGVVQDLANRGSIETAAGLLRGLKDREIAKVLTSLSSKDPRLANQLFEQVRTARQETTIRR